MIYRIVHDIKCIESMTQLSGPVHAYKDGKAASWAVDLRLCVRNIQAGQRDRAPN